MRYSAVSSLLSVALLAVGSVYAADDDDQVMYFDPDTCVDGAGYAKCSKDEYAKWVDCGNNFCNPNTYSGSISDCMDYVCKCVFAEHLLTCAQTYCWNRVSPSC